MLMPVTYVHFRKEAREPSQRNQSGTAQQIGFANPNEFFTIQGTWKEEHERSTAARPLSFQEDHAIPVIESRSHNMIVVLR